MSNFRMFATFAVLLLLCGCSTWREQQRQKSLDAMRAAALADIDTKKCTTDGGTIRGVGMLGTPACVIPFPDAGKTCSDESECQGSCVAPDGAPVGTSISGTCQRDTHDFFGCINTVDHGVVVAGLCAD